jgi:N-acetylglucosamine-6-phosphate deacetylase
MFDLQVNGYAGVDFNQDGLTADELHRACERLEADGTERILATIITEDLGRMCDRLATLAKLREADPLASRVIAGFHIEGPFINETPGYRGAHPADAIRPGSIDEMKRLLDAAGGLTRVVTLAPERDPGLAVTKTLSSAGVVVSAGHCDPSLDQLRGAIDAGLTMFTHLGNACPSVLPRHDNVIQRALSLAADGTLKWATFIADGAHVPMFALKNYLNIVGLDRAIVVSDAIAPAGLGPGRYTLGRWDLQIGDDLVARSPDGSHLVGSAISLKISTENLVTRLGLTQAEARLLIDDNPRRALGFV